MDDRHDLIEAVPVPDDGAQQAIVVGNRRNRRRSSLAALGCGVLVVVLVLSALALRHDDANVSTGASVPPATSPPARLGTALLELPPEALAARPTIPNGWRTIDHGLLELSVPATYFPSNPQANGGCPPPAVIISAGAVDLAATTLLCTSSTTMMQVSSYTTPCTDCGEPRTVNGLRIDSRPMAADCTGCAVRLEIPQLHVRIDLPDDSALIEQVQSTITLSPVARALADGPTADVSSWRAESEGPVALRVPATWRNDEVAQHSLAWGSCGQSPLADHPDAVLRGQGGGIAQCLGTYPPVGPLPMDGVWLWSYEGTIGDREMVDTLDVGGARILIDRFYRPDHVYVETDTPGGKTLVAVAINTDPTIARTVLRTITIRGEHLEPGGFGASRSPTTVTTIGELPSSGTTAPPTSTTSTIPLATTTTRPVTTTAPTTLPPTTSTTIPTPRPTARDLRADLASVGADVGSAPPELWALMNDIPSCGVVLAVPHTIVPPPTKSIPGARCVFAAADRGEAVLVVQQGLTMEGDPIVEVVAVLPDGRVEWYEDASRDRFGRPEWGQQTCLGPLKPDTAPDDSRLTITALLWDRATKCLDDPVTPG